MTRFVKNINIETIDCTDVNRSEKTIFKVMNYQDFSFQSFMFRATEHNGTRTL